MSVVLIDIFIGLMATALRGDTSSDIHEIISSISEHF